MSDNVCTLFYSIFAVGGLVTSGDPDAPSPFHDITVAEYKRMYEFLKQQKSINLANPSQAAVNTSNIFITDLLIPKKQKVFEFTDLHISTYIFMVFCQLYFEVLKTKLED